MWGAKIQVAGKTASVHRKSAALHVQVEDGFMLPRIFDNEV
jgi:hypothetical protein